MNDYVSNKYYIYFDDLRCVIHVSTNNKPFAYYDFSWYRIREITKIDSFDELISDYSDEYIDNLIDRLINLRAFQ